MLLFLLGVVMLAGWTYNVIAKSGRHIRRLPAIMHLLWLLATAVFICAGSWMMYS